MGKSSSIGANSPADVVKFSFLLSGPSIWQLEPWLSLHLWIKSALMVDLVFSGWAGWRDQCGINSFFHTLCPRRASYFLGSWPGADPDTAFRASLKFSHSWSLPAQPLDNPEEVYPPPSSFLDSMALCPVVSLLPGDCAVYGSNRDKIIRWASKQFQKALLCLCIFHFFGHL